MYQVYQVIINNNKATKMLERKSLKSAITLAKREAQKDNFKYVQIVHVSANEAGTKEQSLGSIERAEKEIRTGVLK